MQKIKIQESDLILGEPLTWSVYAANDQLLLSEGYVLKSESQRQLLLSQDLYRNLTPKELDDKKETSNRENIAEISPFVVLDDIAGSLKRALENIYKNLKIENSQTIIEVAGTVQKICQGKSDSVLGAIILNQDSTYIDLHPILCAILTELLNKRRKIPEQDRIPLIAAALTQNVGMWEEQNIMSNQSAPITHRQQKIIKEHPYKTCEILKALGVDNADCLKTILYHHERIDGQGYPKGLSGNEIPESARILALADIYSAMVLPRQYRDGIFVKKALRDIFMQRGSLVDENFAQMLIREIGVYPPGAFVMLKNGETAIVLKHNAKQANCPSVLSIVSPRGLRYETLRVRDTEQEPVFAIEKVIPRPESVKLNLEQIWGVKHST